MRRRLTRLAATLLAVAVGTTGLVGVAGPAAAAGSYADISKLGPLQGRRVEVFEFRRVAAAPEPADQQVAAVAAATCYGGAIWQSTAVSPVTLGGRTGFTTTSRCQDINMRKSTEVPWDVEACVVFVDHTNNCNRWTDISSSWKPIATNVADRTHFKVMVSYWWPDVTGSTAMQLAF